MKFTRTSACNSEALCNHSTMDPGDKDQRERAAFSSSTSMHLSASTFLGLPETFRMEVYERALAVLHPLYLFLGPESSVQLFGPDTPKHWCALLVTNRQISAGASAVLYSVNRFELIDINTPQSRVLKPFLAHIGPMNAASISYLCVSFPTVVEKGDHPGGMELSNESLQILSLLRDNCSNLTTLETVIHYRNARFFEQTDGFLQNALMQIDRDFRTIISLNRFVVRVDHQGAVPTSSAKHMMQSLGWVVTGDGAAS